MHNAGLDNTVVHAKFPGITFVPGYRLQTFIPTDPETGEPMQKLADMSTAESEERFFSLIRTLHVNCAGRKRMGNVDDGG